MTLTEKNEVIARFMGLKKSKADGRYQGLYEKSTFIIPPDHLGYHEYFNWLMPACQKFISCDTSIRYFHHPRVQKVLSEVRWYLIQETSTILDIHQALYEGIEWLNKQNKEV